jgi:Kdo2-lipid IVA lauroyltransferase/acyltransferase
MRQHVLDKPVLYALTSWVALKLPQPVLYGLARIVGALVFVLSPGDRGNVRHNLKRIVGQKKSGPGVRLLMWRLFQNYAFYMVDLFRLLTMPLEDTTAFAELYEGRRHLDEALSKGCGAVLLTAHLGHWEIGGLGLRALGYPINVVTLRHNSLLTNNLINSLRNRNGIRIIELGHSTYDTIELLKVLKRGEVLAVLGDRPFSERSREVQFFGRPVSFPIGPVLLAMAAGAPVVPAFSIMEAPGRYRGIIEPALPMRFDGDREASLRHNLELVSTLFERYIRRYPDQWYHVERI